MVKNENVIAFFDIRFLLLRLLLVLVCHFVVKVKGDMVSLHKVGKT